ncbi:MAG: twin-arginine translocase subunit TatB [Thiogranum sp.]|nr:twin-arginine translocase subunit TatB [Thiogranum sp.]
MFDIGFWELAIIAVVALLVVGPEKLPGLARTAGHWLGRARRFVATVKQDIDREIAADELRKVLAKQAESNPLHDIIEETRQTIHDAQGKPAEPLQKPDGTVTQKPNDPNG